MLARPLGLAFRAITCRGKQRSDVGTPQSDCTQNSEAALCGAGVESPGDEMAAAPLRPYRRRPGMGNDHTSTPDTVSTYRTGQKRGTWQGGRRVKKSAIQVDSTYLAGPTGEVVLLWVHGDGLAGSGPRNVTVFARRPRWLGQVRGTPRGARER